MCGVRCAASELEIRLLFLGCLRLGLRQLALLLRRLGRHQVAEIFPLLTLGLSHLQRSRHNKQEPIKQ